MTTSRPSGVGVVIGLTRRRLVLAVVLAVGLVACGGGGRQVDWRGLELTLPEGWSTFEQSSTLLSVANAPLGEEAGDPGDRTVAVQFTHRPDATVEQHREFVARQGGEIEVDESTTIGGRPARRLVYTLTFDATGTPTREMVVLIPARGLEILLQPVPTTDQTDAPEVFTDYRDEFDRLLASIEFGAPIDR